MKQHIRQPNSNQHRKVLMLFYGALVSLLLIYLVFSSSTNNMDEEKLMHSEETNVYDKDNIIQKPVYNRVKLKRPIPDIGEEDVDETVTGFLVNTRNCRIPDLDPFDSSVAKMIEKNLKKVKCDEKTPFVTYTLGTTLYAHAEAWKTLNNVSISCCRSGLKRDNNVKSDNGIKHDKKCTIWDGKPLKLESEFNQVLCTLKENKTKVVYQNYHAVVLKDKIKTMVPPTKPKGKQKRKYNVLVLGMDAVSRLNFHRHMRLTKSVLLNQMRTIELLGYNKVGDNTFPNVVPMMGGQSVDQLKQGCWPKGKGSFDNCSWLWSDFSNGGYTTMMAEDSPHIASFNYIKKGFFKQPTDYYPRPMVLAADDRIGHTKPLNCKLCHGPITQTEEILKYTQDFFSQLNDRNGERGLFAFVWINSMTHDFVNWPQRVDHMYAKFLQNMTLNGALDDTVIVFLSDHGIRWGSIVSTYVGRMEERLPFSFVYLPPAFRKSHAGLVRILSKINTRRLTTPFDIYHTLRHILALSTGSSPGKSVAKFGQSLFEEVSTNRTCKSAGIPLSWCTCHSSTSVPVLQKDVQMAAKAVVDYINNKKIKQFDSKEQCHRLSLKKVHSASLEKPSSNVTDVQGKDKNIQYYLLSMETTPGGAIFEAAIEKSNDYKVNGQIGRTNLYGNQSRCINVVQLKKFCFCK